MPAALWCLAEGVTLSFRVIQALQNGDSRLNPSGRSEYMIKTRPSQSLPDCIGKLIRGNGDATLMNASDDDTHRQTHYESAPLMEYDGCGLVNWAKSM